ncbi:MAG: efflux RND transporter periplasmic adaptor subunit [Nostoc indistinguendum CM1-VF10]|jgi:HlyD family secretion protein|nr:efflux RND transporter periplasmic adaptor subunit [Nostoc indistinguendum CM1-VF10]
MKISKAEILKSSYIRLIPVLCFLALLSILAGYIIPKIYSHTNIQNEESPSPQRIKVVALGRLEPEGEIISVTGQLGERIARLEISEGSFVKTGQIIAFTESYNEQLQERDLAASQLAEIKERIETDTLTSRVQINQAQAQIQQVDQPQLLQIESQQAIVRRLEAELANAIQVRSRFQKLYYDGAISQQTFDEKKLAVSSAQENLNQAKETLNQLIKSRDTNIQKARIDLSQAKVNFLKVKSHSGLKSTIQQLKLAEARLQRMIIRSPRNGQILKIFAYPGEAISQQGILKLGNTQTMYAVAEVYETDVSAIKLGQQATITSTAFAQPLTGKVSQIGRLVFKNNIIGDDPTAKSDARVVEVKIRLAESKLASNFSQLQVDVAIDLTSPGVQQNDSP